ncbi:MAG: phosphatidylglycerophosphatase A [Oligoflexales bacterium]
MTFKPIKSFPDKISSVFGIGLIPKAPGTWGSIPGLGCAWLGHQACAYLTASPQGKPLNLSAGVLACLLLALLSWGGTWCIAKTEASWNSHDDKSIVIDEVLGQMLASIWFPHSFTMMLSTFILFRIFDIFKPGPIGWVDKNVEIPFGTLLDDLIAGLFAALVYGIIRTFFN